MQPRPTRKVRKNGLSIKYSTTLTNFTIGERKTGESRSFSFLADKEGRRRNFGAKNRELWKIGSRVTVSTRACGFQQKQIWKTKTIEAISAEGKSTPAVNFIDLCYDDVDDEDDDCRVLMFQPSNTQFRKRRKTENGESSNSNTKNDFPSFVCEICVDYKPANELFGIQNCSHSYCKDCINNYVASKLQENITIIKCPVPDCKGSLDLEYCRPILPPEVYDKWGNAVCEAMIVGSQRFYCPFKDCLALLIDDEPEDVVRESECPNCYRMFCAQCIVPWHAGIGCREIQQLHEYERENEDIMLMNIAKKKKWRRCPNCSIYVEKWRGCDHVRCRCGVKFNYSKVARIGGKEPFTMKKPGEASIKSAEGVFLEPLPLMMDEILDHFFSSSSWTDVDVKERSCLDCYENPPTNEMLLSSIGVGIIEDDSNNSATNLSNSNQSMESMAAQSANSSVAHEFESDAQENGNNCSANFSNDQMGLHYDMDGNMVRSTSVSCLEPQNVRCNCCEQSVFQRLNGDFENPSPISQLWPLQAYEGVSSSLCPPGMGQQKLCSYSSNDIYELSDLVTTEKVKQEMGNYPLPTFASGPQIPMAMTGLQSFPQTTSTSPSAECIGPRKPRIRARRGQATDPHSIAERTDKASMLDEIIEYVKFLQQQVKVLSARRLGATGAKGTNGMSDSPSLGHDISFNEIAFDQVLKLMETDVTKAMQYLQSKGLCMMSIALANAILTEKESSPPPDSAENSKNSGFTDDGFVHNPSSSSSSNSTTLPGTDQAAANP
ncbi:hypothetical protein ACLB2K_003180 [Fragaria x ananassa]